MSALRHSLIDFQAIAAAAQPALPALVRRWLPDGRREPALALCLW